MPRAVTHCPNCGQRVTPFAAGCAVCGADLDAARAARAARSAKLRIELPRLSPGGGSAGGHAIDWAHLAVAVLVALAIPPVGLLLALFWASRRHRDGDLPMTVAMLATAVLAAVAMFAPEWFFSHLFHL